MSDNKWDDFAIASALNYYKNRSNTLEYELVLYKASIEKKVHGYEDTIKVLKSHIEKLEDASRSKTKAKSIKSKSKEKGL
jgi:hypothetical protein